MPKTTKSKEKEIEADYFLDPHREERKEDKYRHFWIRGFLFKGDFILSKDCEPLPKRIILNLREDWKKHGTA